MSKPLLGLILGGILGMLDGLSALFYPEVSDQILFIVAASTFKGLVAGVITGVLVRKLNSVPLGILVGLLVAAAVTLYFAISPDPNTGQVYFWEIMIPGSIVGAIVGFAATRYGRRSEPAAATAR